MSGAPDLLGHAPPPLPAKGWLPAEHDDEGPTPLPRASPQDWLIKLDDSGWGIDGDELANDPSPRRLAEGEIVEFQWWMELPGGVLVIPARKEDWIINFTEPPEVEGGVPLFRIDWDNENTFDSLEEAVAQLDGGDEYQVDVFVFGAEHVRFRHEAGTLVEVGADG